MSLELASEVGNVVLQGENGALLSGEAAAALAVGLAALAAGYSQRAIGAAAVGAMAENEDLFSKGLVLTVLPETLVVLALVVVVLVG